MENGLFDIIIYDGWKINEMNMVGVSEMDVFE